MQTSSIPSQRSAVLRHGCFESQPTRPTTTGDRAVGTRAAREGLRLVTGVEGPAADSRLEGSEQADKLRWAISQLPENQRQVLLLRYYSELKFSEIAQMLGCPLNTALGRMHKAMIKLKALMDD